MILSAAKNNHGENLTLWQFDGEERRLFKGKFESIDEEKIYILLGSIVAEGGFNLNPDKTLYIHSEYRHLIFKRDTFAIQGNQIKVKTPSELKLEDLRGMDRFTYKYQDHKLVCLSLNRPSEDGENIESVKLLSGPMVDINLKGVALVLGIGDVKTLEKDDEVCVTSITDQGLAVPIKAWIKSKVPYDKHETHKKLVRVGLLFEDLLESVSYKSIQSIVEKKQTKVKGLDVDTFNGLDPDEQEKILATLEYTDKKLAISLRENLEVLYRLRFLTSQMKKELFLRFDGQLFATALRLCTKEIILELLVELTDNLRKEMLDHLAEPKPLSAIDKAQSQVIKIVREMEASGELVLDAVGYVKLV